MLLGVECCWLLNVVGGCVFLVVVCCVLLVVECCWLLNVARC